MNFEEDFAHRQPDAVENRGGSTYIAVDFAGDFIDEAERRGIGILGMEGFLIGKLTYPALGRMQISREQATTPVPTLWPGHVDKLGRCSGDHGGPHLREKRIRSIPTPRVAT